LHLTFTQSYWNDLCGRVLERPLHHNPSKGGAAEAERLREQYVHTLQLYREEFGYDAPVRYWPPAKAQAGKASASRWVLAGAGAAAAVTGGAAFAAAEPVTEAASTLEHWLIVGGVILAVTCAGAVIDAIRFKKKKPGEEDDGSNWDFDFDFGGRRRKSGGDGDDKDDGEGGGDGGDGGGGGGCGGGGCGD
jgi:hypothetical protein